MYAVTSEKEQSQATIQKGELLSIFGEYIDAELLTYSGLRQVIVNDKESGIFKIESC